MRLHLYIVLSIILVSIISCKKENPVSISSISDVENSYYPLTVGSYWIYRWVEIDNETGEMINSFNQFDTIKVLKDTIIYHHRYAKISDKQTLLSNNIEIYYQRDSFGYIVNQFQQIYFSRNNFTDTLFSFSFPNFLVSNKKMIPGIESVETDAGVFDCLNFQEQVEPLNSAATCEFMKFDNLFSKGVGRIKESYYYGSQLCNKTIQRQLIEYHIEPE